MTFLVREWGLLRWFELLILDLLLLAHLLRNMPKISIMDGNPLNRADIRAVKVLRKINKTFFNQLHLQIGEPLPDMRSPFCESP